MALPPFHNRLNLEKVYHIRRLNTPVVWIASSLKPYMYLINKTFKETNPKRCQAPFSLNYPPKKPFSRGNFPLRGNVLSFCSRVFLSIYTPVVWIATLLSLKMVVSLTKYVYIYSCYLDRLLSERYKKSDAKVRIAIFFSSVRRLNKVYFRCNFVALILLLFGSGLHKSLCSLNK